MDNWLLVIDIIIPIITALIGIWYTRQYLTDSYRRKILKVMFLEHKRKYPLKNGKEESLNDLLEDIYLWKFVIKFLFLGVFISIIWALGYYKSFNGMIIAFNFFAITYYFSLIFLYYLSKYNKENLNKINKNKYIIKTSFHIINSDFIFEWFLLTMIFLYFLFKNFNLSVLLSNWVFVLAIFWMYTFLLLLPIFFQYVSLFEKYTLKHNDLEYVIFQDFNNIINIPIIVHIIIHINGETIKGKIKEIGDELVLINDETESHPITYVPWENIVFFEIVIFEITNN